MAAVFTAAACEHHPGHPEQPARITAVWRRLREDGRFTPIEAAPAELDYLTLRHPREFVLGVEARAFRGEPAGEETPLSRASWPAVLGAAGAVSAAVRHAMAHGAAFAAVRPPGHHASADRAMGFCPVNLVTCAVAQARLAGAERALIVDWDVHHGNGTQDIVAREDATRFVSMHQHPWYPGTGMASERGVGNCFNVPLPPGLSRAQYVAELWAAIEAAGDGWMPDAIFVSAGYDAMAGDPLGGFTLEPEDYATLVARLRDRWPDAPLVGVMEGGYAPERLADGVLATVAAMGGATRKGRGAKGG